MNATPQPQWNRTPEFAVAFRPCSDTSLALMQSDRKAMQAKYGNDPEVAKFLKESGGHNSPKLTTAD